MIEVSELRILFEEFPGMYHLGTTVFQKNDTETLTCRDKFLLSYFQPSSTFSGFVIWLYAFSISFSLHFKQASHIRQKEERAWRWLFWQDTRHRDLPFPLAFIFFCMFLLGNWTQKGHLASWQLREVGVGNIKQKQTIDMRMLTLCFCFSSSFFRRD